MWNFYCVSPDDCPDERDSVTSDSGYSDCSSTDSNLRQYQPPGISGLTKIPESVFVVCAHFLQDNFRRPESVYAEVKTCEFCEQCGMLKYATWNNKHYYWQVMRPYPIYRIPPGAVFNECQHFSTDSPCPRESCICPHGKQEEMMWTLERDGRKYICYILKSLFVFFYG